MKENKMKYHVWAKVVGSKYLGEVEADSEEEAIEKGRELDECGIFLCYQCSSECEDAEMEEITVDELNEEA